MTNRRPDIHCTGCGVYCYSLSHRPDEQVFPESHYCDKCKGAISRGMRTSDMLNQAWSWMFVNIKIQFQIISKISDAHDEKIRAFKHTMECKNTKERPFVDVPNKITVAEWKEISKEKLAYFKKYCNKKELSFLNNFINSAHEMTDIEKKKIESEERKAREKESSETRRFFRNMWKNIMK